MHTVQYGATLMSSFLVNSALILLASSAVVQFCATAFEAYAQQTSIQEIFSNDIYHLQSVRPLFKNNVFIWIMLGFSLLTVVWLCIRGPTRRRKRPMTLEETYAAG
jgi:LMBR1 domain-containing protein 1